MVTINVIANSIRMFQYLCSKADISLESAESFLKVRVNHVTCRMKTFEA